jgi:hypothetical protein
MHDELHFYVRNNVDWNQPIQVNDYDTTTNTTAPHDLTGATLRMEVEVSPPGSAPPVLDLSTASGGGLVITNASGGQIEIAVPATQINTVPGGCYVGDMLIFGADGSVTLAFIARIEVRAGETDPNP